MAHKRKILTVLLLSAAPAFASPHQPPPDDQAPRALLTLRSKLFEAGAQKARTQVATFKPLCDKDGYPLVGNVASKGNLYQPSEFCADQRRATKP